MEKTRLRILLALGAGLLGALALLGANAGTCVPVEPAAFVPPQSDRVSGCGGFGAEPAQGAFALRADGYCDAEVLRWQYDAAAGTLALSDERVMLNCCGDHAMDVVIEDGVWVVTETDEPEGGSGRCHCLCVFDFALTVEDVAAGTIALRLLRFVTETGETLVWEGALDLAEGAGAIVLDETSVEPWCE